MKNVAISLMGIFALPLISSCWPSAASLNQAAKAPRMPTIVFEAKATKAIYARGEPVEFNFTLRNVGGETLIVARRLHLSLNVNLEISGSQEKPVRWCGRIAEVIPSRSLYRTLSPGESVNAKLIVTCVDKDDARRAWGYSLSVPGKYVVKASYRLLQPREVFEKLFPNEQVVRGPVLAEPVTIELQ